MKCWKNLVWAKEVLTKWLDLHAVESSLTAEFPDVFYRNA